MFFVDYWYLPLYFLRGGKCFSTIGNIGILQLGLTSVWKTKLEHVLEVETDVEYVDHAGVVLSLLHFSMR